MSDGFVFRQADKEDLLEIIRLLREDELGKERESYEDLASYGEAFNEITVDRNQLLMVIQKKDKIIGTCHLTLMPSLAFQGSKRMNIESVRIDEKWRGQGIGEKMIKQILKIAKEHGCKMVQLTTHKKRIDAKRFYEKLGFEGTHEGMKLYLN